MGERKRKGKEGNKRPVGRSIIYYDINFTANKQAKLLAAPTRPLSLRNLFLARFGPRRH